MENKSNQIIFRRYFLGASAGTSKKGNDYCMVNFLEINRFKKGEVISLSTPDNILPPICEDLVAGDFVEIVVEPVSMSSPPILISINRIITPSVLVPRENSKKE